MEGNCPTIQEFKECRPTQTETEKSTNKTKIHQMNRKFRSVIMQLLMAARSVKRKSPERKNQGVYCLNLKN